ncbi:unnamed protein product, partial [marine sediment metagenome]
LKAPRPEIPHQDVKNNRRAGMPYMTQVIYGNSADIDTNLSLV